MPRSLRWFLLALSMLPGPAAAEALTPYLLDPAETPRPELARRVNEALAQPIVTIVDKPAPSPTGDPHDYVSYARYFWPDPTKPDGLPWVQKDGHPNREQIALGDGRQLAALLSHTETLALGWRQLQRDDCALRAAAWLRAWFIAPATRLNPSFGYAQIRLGREENRGSPYGLIDTRGLVGLIDAVRLLHGAPGFGAAEEDAVKAWFSEYLHWLTTSPNGRKERAGKNNHGSWYLVQAVAIARFLGRDHDARAFAREDLARLDWQIEPDGRQPLELARPDGLSYSLFNLEAQLRLARLAAPLGVDVWRYETPRGGSLKRALAYLKTYDADPAQWPHRQLAPVRPGFLRALLAQAALLDSLPAAP